MGWRMLFRGAFAFLLVFLVSNSFATEIQRKSFNAVYTTHPPTIDGRLDDPSYFSCSPDFSLTQCYPDEGRPPSEKTEFWVLYDHANLYIAVRAFDSQPQRVAGRLTRRDESSESDWIQIVLDPYLDRRTGVYFALNPAGVKVDAAYYNDTDWDISWDEVWDGAAKRDSLGWCAEFSIPFSILRFKPGPELTFGLNVNRVIERRKEEDLWMPIYNGESGLMSRAGHLTGLRGIAQPRHLELLPYAVSRVDSKPRDPLTNPKGTSYEGHPGLDLKYGLASNLTLNATMNPDFGQVEADPVVLNLSAYETFYPEKRPFFLEGATTFNMPMTLFYSRRIGKALYQGGTQYSVNTNTDAVKQFPDFAPILTAGKLTGKVGKISLGILDGVTGQAYATVDSSGVDLKRLVEPCSNYLVLRSQADLGASSLGLLGTAVNREGLEPAGTGGLDWRWRFAKNTYSFKG